MDETNACVGMAMDVALMAFGPPEPAFEVEVVAGQVVVAIDVVAREQAGGPALHEAGQGQVKRRGLRAALAGQLVEAAAPVLARAGGRIERAVHVAHLAYVLGDLGQVLPDEGETGFDARLQALPLVGVRPPFFAFTLRRREAWTSVRASLIRKPGGCSGPPG